MVDGVGSMDVAALMLDATATPAERSRRPSRRRPCADDDHGLLAGIPGRAVGAARAGADLAVHPGKLRETLSNARGRSPT